MLPRRRAFLAYVCLPGLFLSARGTRGRSSGRWPPVALAAVSGAGVFHSFRSRETLCIQESRSHQGGLDAAEKDFKGARAFGSICASASSGGILVVTRLSLSRLLASRAPEVLRPVRIPVIT
eukprot:3828052-Pyramimonas_sp.AAC.1